MDGGMELLLGLRLVRCIDGCWLLLFLSHCNLRFPQWK